MVLCLSPSWPCNKVLKPNFQSIISQTNNGCSYLSLILAKRLLLDVNCKNNFAVTALTACTFSVKKFARKWVFFMWKPWKFVGGWRLRTQTPWPPAAGRFTPRPPLQIPGCATAPGVAIWCCFCVLSDAASSFILYNLYNPVKFRICLRFVKNFWYRIRTTSIVSLLNDSFCSFLNEL